MEQKNKPYSRIVCFGNDTKNIFLKTAIIIIELKYYYKEVISVSKYILENYLIGQSIGVKPGMIESVSKFLLNETISNGA